MLCPQEVSSTKLYDWKCPKCGNVMEAVTQPLCGCNSLMKRKYTPLGITWGCTGRTK